MESPPHPIAAIRLLLLTGARLGEILTLRWDYVDRERGCLKLPDSKTGAKEIHLNEAAFAVSRRPWPRELDNPYVIIGQRSGAHLVNLEKPWQAGFRGAGQNLDNVSASRPPAFLRLHRRWSGPRLADDRRPARPTLRRRTNGKGMPTLAVDPLRAANELIGRQIASLIAGSR